MLTDGSNHPRADPLTTKARELQREYTMSTYIVLLRGVMPSGKNKVPMARLREVLKEAVSVMCVRTSRVVTYWWTTGFRHRMSENACRN